MSEEERRRLVVLSAAFAALGVLAFSRSLGFGFVYDDRWTIVHNDWLDEPLGKLLAVLENGTANARGVPDATRPAMVVSLFVDRRLFGASPLGYHLHSLLLYGAACAAATWCARSLLGGGVAFVAASAFFALAPLHTEVVCAVNYREDCLAGAGVLAALAWLFRPGIDEDSPGASAVIALVSGWALLAKESAMVLLPLVVVAAAILRVDRAWLRARERTLWAVFATLVLWLNWRLALTLGDDGIPRAPDASMWVRLCETGRYAFRALLAALLPFRPSPEYAADVAASPSWLVALLIVAVGVALATRSVRHRPAASGVAVAIVGALGSSPVFRPVNPWADRYVFWSILGGGLVWGTLAEAALSRVPTAGRRAVLAAAVVFGIALTAGASGVWHDDRALWSYAVLRTPDSPRAWAALSRVERLSGDLDAADRDLARALAIRPNHVPSHVTRVYNLLARGNVWDARAELRLVEDLGGASHPGIALARTCAKQPPEAAKLCIRGGN